jgi:hypothetical protein
MILQSPRRRFPILVVILIVILIGPMILSFSSPLHSLRYLSEIPSQKPYARAVGFPFALSKIVATMLFGTGSKQNGSIE